MSSVAHTTQSYSNNSGCWHDRMEGGNRLSVEKIFKITDELHTVWDYLTTQKSTDALEIIKGKISSEIAEMVHEYQDVLNFDQRKRLAEGLN